MRKVLLGAAAAAALIAATPASAQVYAYPAGDGHYYLYPDSRTGAQAQVSPRARTRVTTPSPYVLGGQPVRRTDPDAFIRDYMRNQPPGAEDE